jgi:hypothetical protein
MNEHHSLIPLPIKIGTGAGESPPLATILGRGSPLGVRGMRGVNQASSSDDFCHSFDFFSKTLHLNFDFLFTQQTPVPELIYFSCETQVAVFPVQPHVAFDLSQ